MGETALRRMNAPTIRQNEFLVVIESSSPSYMLPVVVQLFDPSDWDRSAFCSFSLW